jgi:hypothetical protein
MRPTIEIPIEEIRRVLDYDLMTGAFRWKVRVADKVRVGQVAGSNVGSKYTRIMVGGVMYQAHRLAWAYMTGEQPPQVIDHENGNRLDNRWANLRAADVSTNGANRPAQRNSRTKTKGVHHYPGLKKPWLARLTCRGQIKLNRYFATEQQAAEAYAAAAALHFGEFARRE